jgi:hypothetical protein
MSRSKFNVGGREGRSLDGYVFDSAAERDRYAELLILERVGVITKLELQPRFEIIPKTVKGTRAHHYTADFRYVEDGVCVIEDVKGVKTKDYILRRDIFIKDYIRAGTIFREYARGVIKEFTA